MQQKKTEPLEPKFFVLTEPEERVQEFMYQNKRQLASQGFGTTGSSSFRVNSSPIREQSQEDLYDSVLSKDVDYRIFKAHELIQREKERIEKHKAVRANQLLMEEEARVKHLIREREYLLKEQAFQQVRQEIAADRNLAFQKINTIREQHWDKVQQENQRIDEVSYAAYPVHIREVEERFLRLKQEELIEAQNSHDRAVRDEAHLLQMHHEQQVQADIEAEESR